MGDSTTVASCQSLSDRERSRPPAGVPFRYLEPGVGLHDEPGEQIREHFDFADRGSPDHWREIVENGQRIVTFLVYVRYDYEGGATALPELGIAQQGRRGSGMFFVNAFAEGTPDSRTVHVGWPTSRGEKRVGRSSSGTGRPSERP